MKKIILTIILVLGLLVISSAREDGIQIQNVAFSSNLDTELVQTLQERSMDGHDGLRVVVLLNEDTKDTKKTMASYNSPAYSGVEIKHTYDTIPAFAAEVEDLQSLAALSYNSKVKRIGIDTPVHAFLNDSSPQINANQAWNIAVSGTNITGAGETVCIIDTGINYSHLAFAGGCNPVNFSLVGTITNQTLESDHPYSNNIDTIWNITKPGYSNIAVHFSNITLEVPTSNADATDRVYVYDKWNRTLAVYKGAMLDRWSPYAEGDTIYVRLLTDASVTDYGFKIDQVINGTTNMTMNWTSCNSVIGGYDTVNNDVDPYDDHSHGSHVAGIVASNDSAYKGVAPNAKIVSVKALDSSGSGLSSDIAAGIEWCIRNATVLNISVISMSLGGGQYTKLCDTSSDVIVSIIKPLINDAYKKNIMTVVATGNTGGSLTNASAGIASPACIANSTRVTAVDKSDAMASYAFRHFNFTDTIAAPGTSIVSVDFDDTFVASSGTSMAAPQVAGVVALMRQYWRLAYGQTPTIAQVQDKMRLTGKSINDSLSELLYPRINVLALLQPYLNYTLSSQPNASSIAVNYLFINLSSDVNITSAYLEMNFSNGSVINYSMSNTSRTLWNLNLSNVGGGTHYYKVYANDSGDLFGVAQVRSISVDNTAPQVNLLLPLPTNYTQNNTPVFTFNYSDAALTANCTLRVGDADYGKNTSVSNATNTRIVANASITDAYYSWSITCSDTLGNAGSSSRNITIDTTVPTVNAGIPASNNLSSSTTPSFTFNFTDNLASNGSCTLLINNVSYGVNSTTLNRTNTNIQANSSLGDAQYFWQINCTDIAANTANSTMRNITIDTRGPTVTVNAVNGKSFGQWSNNTAWSINFTVQDIFIANWTLTVYNSSWALLQSVTGTTNNESIVSYTAAANGTYYVNLTGADTLGHSNQSSFTIGVDTLIPGIHSASAGSIDSSSATITVNSTDTISNVSVCNYTQSSSSGNLSLSAGLYSVSLSSLSASTSYTVSISCLDAAGNVNASVVSFTTSAASSGGSSGGGGGGGGGGSSASVTSSTDTAAAAAATSVTDSTPAVASAESGSSASGSTNTDASTAGAGTQGQVTSGSSASSENGADSSSSNLVGGAIASSSMSKLSAQGKVLLGIAMLIILLSAVYFVFLREK